MVQRTAIYKYIYKFPHISYIITFKHTPYAGAYGVWVRGKDVCDVGNLNAN